MPHLTGVNHISLSVTDLDRSEAFYTKVLGLVRMTDLGDVRVLVEPTSGFQVALAAPPQRTGSTFSELNTGLDHIGLSAGSRADLEEWVRRFDAVGVRYTPILDLPLGHHLNFRDPDDIAWEFYVPNPDATQGFEQLRERPTPAEETEAYVEQVLHGAP